MRTLLVLSVVVLTALSSQTADACSAPGEITRILEQDLETPANGPLIAELEVSTSSLSLFEAAVTDDADNPIPGEIQIYTAGTRTENFDGFFNISMSKVLVAWFPTTNLAEDQVVKLVVGGDFPVIAEFTVVAPTTPAPSETTIEAFEVGSKSRVVDAGCEEAEEIGACPSCETANEVTEGLWVTIGRDTELPGLYAVRFAGLDGLPRFKYLDIGEDSLFIPYSDGCFVAHHQSWNGDVIEASAPVCVDGHTYDPEVDLPPAPPEPENNSHTENNATNNGATNNSDSNGEVSEGTSRWGFRLRNPKHQRSSLPNSTASHSSLLPPPKNATLKREAKPSWNAKPAGRAETRS